MSRQCSLSCALPEPLIVDADAAGERHLPVDDQDLAVGAVVDFFERVPARRVERRQPAAGGAQPLDVVVGDRAAANGVDDEVDADAAARGRLRRRA